VRSRLRVLTAALLLVTATPLWAAGPPAPDRAEVKRALEKVKADPNLAPERTVRTLRWVNQSDPPAQPSGSLEWLTQLINWFAQSARMVVWVAVALLVGLLVIFVLPPGPGTLTQPAIDPEDLSHARAGPGHPAGKPA